MYRSERSTGSVRFYFVGRKANRNTRRHSSRNIFRPWRMYVPAVIRIDAHARLFNCPEIYFFHFLYAYILHVYLGYYYYYEFRIVVAGTVGQNARCVIIC